MGAVGFEPTKALSQQIYSLPHDSTQPSIDKDLRSDAPESAAQTTAREAGKPPISLPTDPTRQAILTALEALSPADVPDALAIVQALPTMPPAVRAGVVAMVNAAKGGA